MDFLSFILLGVSLSMDALAVSVSTGICVPDLKKRDALKIGLYFGGFQALMPTLGWLLGTSAVSYTHLLLLCSISGRLSRKTKEGWKRSAI